MRAPATKLSAPLRQASPVRGGPRHKSGPSCQARVYFSSHPFSALFTAVRISSTVICPSWLASPASQAVTAAPPPRSVPRERGVSGFVLLDGRRQSRPYEPHRCAPVGALTNRSSP